MLISDIIVTNSINGSSASVVPYTVRTRILKLYYCNVRVREGKASTSTGGRGVVTAACDIFCVCVDDSKGGWNDACCNSSFICKSKHTHTHSNITQAG